MTAEEQVETPVIDDAVATAVKRKIDDGEEPSKPEEAPVTTTEEPKEEPAKEETTTEETSTEEPASKKAKTSTEEVEEPAATTTVTPKKSKGKGKSKIAQRYASEPEDDDDDDEDEDDDGVFDEHRIPEDEAEEDSLEEIDTSNIIVGRRTRGKVIDYKKTLEELEKKNANGSGEPLLDDDEDDEADGNFQDTEA